MKRAVVIVTLPIVLTAMLTAASPLHAQDAPAPAAQLGRIAYASDVDGDFEIFVMRPDGTRRRQITHNRVDDVAPSWSPDGTRIVFERDTSFYGDDLYIADLDGGPAIPWKETKRYDEGKPSWSPDGEWIAYRGGGPQDDLQLFMIPLDKSGGYSIFAEENASVSWPAWSPDGSKVAFFEYSDGSAMRVAPTCCDTSPRYESVPADTEWPAGLDWSRDGSCLVYGDVSGRGYDLHTIPSGGGTAQPITSGRSDSYPGSWSPDSSQIVYDSNAAKSWDVYVIDADGSDASRLTRTPEVHEIDPEWWAPPGVEPITPPCGQTPAEPSPSPSPSSS